MNNDRFKFRAWSIRERKYHYDIEDAYSNDSHICSDIPNDQDGYPNYHHFFGEIITDPGYITEQCTGLKDKNGKLIYEGDVVSFSWQLKDNEVCKIVWDKIHCSFACVDIKTRADFITWYSVFENGQSNRCEIIGNIHEMEVTK